MQISLIYIRHHYNRDDAPSLYTYERETTPKLRVMEVTPTTVKTKSSSVPSAGNKKYEWMKSGGIGNERQLAKDEIQREKIEIQREKAEIQREKERLKEEKKLAKEAKRKEKQNKKEKRTLGEEEEEEGEDKRRKEPTEIKVPFAPTGS